LPCPIKAFRTPRATKMKTFLIAAFCILLLIAAIGVASILLRKPPIPAPPLLPNSDEIMSISARLYGEQLGFASVAEFDVPPKYWPDLLAIISPVKPEPMPGPTVDLGYIRIVSTNGNEIDLHLHWFGTGPATYTIDGISCVRGGAYKAYGNPHQFLDESITIYGVIEEIHKVTMVGEKPHRLDDYLSLLKRSAAK
jgi:hypothetical protein